MLEDNLKDATMISRILPHEVATAEDFGPFSGSLWAEEAQNLDRALPARRAEFAAGRSCAHRALELLGAPVLPVLRGIGREPLWPAGIVGSITHCDGYCAAAVARRGDIAGIGIDAEPNETLPGGILDLIASEEEIGLLPGIGSAQVSWDRLFFCVKESVYKAWYPVMKYWLGFEEAFVTIEPGLNIFHVQLHSRNPHRPVRCHSRLTGHYAVQRGYIMTSVIVYRNMLQDRANASY
jgi:4'-phosphopantetheinyl transferase EntD